MGFEPTIQAIKDSLNNREKHVSHVDYPHAYASEALKCRRQIGYRVAGFESADEFSTHSLIAWSLGNHIHNIVQNAYRDLYPDFQDEVRWELDGLTGRADGLFTHPQHGKTLLEIKTMSPRYYAAAVKGNVPQSEHMLQADISAYALQTERVEIVYVVKVKEGDLEPIHIWNYKADLKGAKEEIESLQRVVAMATEGYILDREYEGEQIEDPSKRRWPCGFCGYRDRCIKDGPGLITLNRVTRLT